MTDLVVLQSKHSSPCSPLRAAEILDDPEALLERIRGCPGDVAWVAIAADVPLTNVLRLTLLIMVSFV